MCRQSHQQVRAHWIGYSQALLIAESHLCLAHPFKLRMFEQLVPNVAGASQTQPCEVAWRCHLAWRSAAAAAAASEYYRVKSGLSLPLNPLWSKKEENKYSCNKPCFLKCRRCLPTEQQKQNTSAAGIRKVWYFVLVIFASMRRHAKVGINP